MHRTLIPMITALAFLALAVYSQQYVKDQQGYSPDDISKLNDLVSPHAMTLSEQHAAIIYLYGEK